MKFIKGRSKEDGTIVSDYLYIVEYFCEIFEKEGELNDGEIKSLKNAIEVLEVYDAIDSTYQWGVEVLNKCGVKYKGLKESNLGKLERINESYIKGLGSIADDNYDFIMIDDDIYTNIGSTGQYYRGDFIERKKINELEYFVFEIREFREDGLTYEGEFLPIGDSSQKRYPFIVGIIDGDKGVCNPYCKDKDCVRVLGDFIVSMNFDNLYWVYPLKTIITHFWLKI